MVMATTETPLSQVVVERDGNRVFIRVGDELVIFSDWAARRFGEDVLRAAGVDLHWAAWTPRKR
jgi:hypothetical protein